MTDLRELWQSLNHEKAVLESHKVWEHQPRNWDKDDIEKAKVVVQQIKALQEATELVRNTRSKLAAVQATHNALPHYISQLRKEVTKAEWGVILAAMTPHEASAMAEILRTPEPPAETVVPLPLVVRFRRFFAARRAQGWFYAVIGLDAVCFLGLWYLAFGTHSGWMACWTVVLAILVAFITVTLTVAYKEGILEEKG